MSQQFHPTESRQSGQLPNAQQPPQGVQGHPRQWSQTQFQSPQQSQQQRQT